MRGQALNSLHIVRWADGRVPGVMPNAPSGFGTTPIIGVRRPTPVISFTKAMRRRTFLHHTLVGSAAFGLTERLSASAARLPRKPNLIVFLPDQQRADTLAPYGRGRTHAPNLNKLASQATVFDRAYVTQPVCTPSRSSLMTGLWPHQSGCTENNQPLAANCQTLPELVADPDYRCAYFGKWHLGDEVFAQRGFHDWISIEDIYQDHFSAGREQGRISDYSRFLLEKGLKPDVPARGTFSRKFASRLPIELSKPVFLERHACDFLERYRRQPFILFVSFLEPHTPYFGPLNNEHRPDEVEFDANVTHTFGEDLPLKYRLKQEGQAVEYGRTPEDFRPIKRNYMGLVTQIDRSIGGVLKKLDDLGLTDDTIVVHTSDHGDMMGSHRLFEKEVMFEESVRVPYLVRLPGQRRPNRIAPAVSHIDFVPTMLDLIGRPAHAQCAGRSLAPALRGELLRPKPVFLQWSPKPGRNERVKKDSVLASADDIARVCGESTRTVITADGWKLSLRDADRAELYHLPRDPGELRNLLPAAPAGVVPRLASLVREWQKASGDKLELAAVP